MRSFLAALRSLVLPFGRTTGARIVLDGINGIIQVYDAGNIKRVEINSQDAPPGIKVFGTNGDTLKMRVSANARPTLDYDLVGHSGNASIYMQPSDLDSSKEELIIAYFGSPSAMMRFRPDELGRGQIFVDHTIVPLDPTIPTPWASETWHDFALANGWANTVGYANAGYRLMPDGNVRLRGLITGGTNADGTALCTINANYWPQASKHLAASSSLAGRTPVINLTTTGVLQIFRIAGIGGAVGLDGISYERD